MEKIGKTQPQAATIAVEVAVITLWDNDHQVIGHAPAIFGPGKGPGIRTLYALALHPDAGNIDKARLYPTPEEALRAWQSATPREMNSVDGSYYKIADAQRKIINAEGLYREQPAPFTRG